MNEKRNGTPIAFLGEANFEADVLQSKQPVLVAFSAPWSRPCQALDPTLQELASALVGKAKVIRVNADESLGLSLLYDIQAVPTLVCFAEGKPRLRIVGTATKQAILGKLKAFRANETVVSRKGAAGMRREPGKEN